MVTIVKGQRFGISYAGSDSRLVDRLPLELKPDQRVTPSFDYEANPQRREELRAHRKTESERRGEQGPDSMMVKLHKPFPEPKPRSHLGVLREHFNRQWAEEMRRAQTSQNQTQMIQAVSANPALRDNRPQL